MHEIAQYIVDTINKNANEYTEFVRRKKKVAEVYEEEIFKLISIG